MPSVPERPLSYGELLNSLRLKYRTRQRQAEQAKKLAPKKPRNKRNRTSYTYEDVKKHIDNL